MYGILHLEYKIQVVSQYFQGDEKNLRYDEENENRRQVLEEDRLRILNLTKRHLCKVDKGY